MNGLQVLRRDGITETGECIRTQAKKQFKEVYPDADSKNFKASNGCLQRSTASRKITFGSVTSRGKNIPENANFWMNSFYPFLWEKLQENQTTDVKNITNMAKTPLWFDAPKSRTYDFSGVKAVKSKTTRQEKLSYSVFLSAMADGHKLKSMIIYKNLRNAQRATFLKMSLYKRQKVGE